VIQTRPRTPVPVALVAVLALAALVAMGCNREPAATGVDDPLPSAVEETLDPFPSVDKPSLPAGLETDKPHGSSTATMTQTDTDWGRVWDALPTGFPIPPGAIRSDEAGSDGAVSATYAIAGTDAAAIAAWMQAELELATYSTEALSGPLEDGSFVIDSVGDAGCRIETGVRPAGDTILVTVRYGADCPFG
jgi:hypothetical protein